MSQRERRLQRIAVGLAGVAVLTTSLAVVVVVTRHSDRELDGDREAARRAPHAGVGGSLDVVPPASPPRDPLIETVTRLGKTTYQVPRSTFEAWLANPAAIASGGVGTPASDPGRPAGFELHAIQPGSVYAALGIEDGDTIRAINGYGLTSIDQALELIAKSTTQITLDLRRRGEAIMLNYLIK